jgi:phosphate transport system permease protein
VIAVPVGILTGIEIAEFGTKRRYAWLLQCAVDILSGVPSIISGMFVYGLLVKTGITGYSVLAAGSALAILMIPTIARTTEEALTLVPQELRLGAYGLGASRSQTVLKIVLPVAMPGILSGAIIATARASGETAPLLFTALFSPFWPEGVFTPIASLAVMIYNYASVPYENLQSLAWASALMLILWVLATNIVCRFLIGSTSSRSVSFYRSTPKVKHK